MPENEPGIGSRSGPGAMVRLRERRARLLEKRWLTWVFGADHLGVRIEEAYAGSIRLRVHRPAGPARGPRPLVLALHGGGWCWGSPEQSRWSSSAVAAGVDAVVVAPAYRLAPEHPYPAAVEDAWAALEWALAHAGELGADPDRLAVLGDSSGATLAAVTCLQARDRGGPRIAGQVLVYPVVDLGERWPEAQAGPVGPGRRGGKDRWVPGLDQVVHDYLGGSPEAATDELASPLRAASHEGLPPALVLTAGLDPLRPHAERYARALAAAGVPVETYAPRLATHSYLTLPGISLGARGGLARTVAFLRGVL